MAVSHPSALLQEAGGAFEGATSRLAQIITSSDAMELEEASGNLGGVLVDNESSISWITGKLTISF
jgi:hypothetical protein